MQSALVAVQICLDFLFLSNGDIALPCLTLSPLSLIELLTSDSKQSREFKIKLKLYNSILSFLSMVENVDTNLANAIRVYSWDDIPSYWPIENAIRENPKFA